jgi:hypothetical protein
LDFAQYAWQIAGTSSVKDCSRSVCVISACSPSGFEHQFAAFGCALPNSAACQLLNCLLSRTPALNGFLTMRPAALHAVAALAAVPCLVLQTCMVAFAQLALCPSTPYNSGQVQTLLAEESEALKRLAPLDCSFQNMNQLRTAAPPPPPGSAAAGASYNGSSRASCSNASANGSSSSSGGSGRQGPKPVQASYGQLMDMRVRELKRLLQEHGVNSEDCFEKEELVKRVLERCTLSA